MADKNLHDIKIDELDSPKKTPLKNILTLLALLFIILVISVVITKLILNTDEGATIENNDSKSELLKDKNETNNDDVKKDDKESSSEMPIPVISSNIIERNLTSAIKTPLTSHQPKEIKTYNTPKKNNTTEAKKDAPVKEVKKVPTTTHVVNRTPTAPKKEYIDKVVIQKSTNHTTQDKSSTNSHKTASFLGGQRKDITNSYYIKVGTYRDTTSILEKVKKNNFNYAIVKVENDKTLFRVLVGPFFSRNQANAQLAKVQANILTGAYVTKAK